MNKLNLKIEKKWVDSSVLNYENTRKEQHRHAYMTAIKQFNMAMKECVS